MSDEVEVRELTLDEGREVFDGIARRYLGISGDEFLIRWDRGEYEQPPGAKEDTDLEAVVFHLPFAGRAR